MTQHISVCVPTYRRPALLAKCLDALACQEGDLFTFSVVVVDNDPERSANSTVLARTVGSRPIVYRSEPEPNISLARNAAVAAADGDLIAFIDDDEFADRRWLSNMLATLQRTGADGVLGPVLPHFDPKPPEWLVKSGVCMRNSFPTDTELLEPKHMRTGNLLFKRSMVAAVQQPFDPKYGRSGGEDVDFFDRMLKRGRRFAWCDEAPVHEVVPRERQTLKYYLKRALIRGVTQATMEPVFSLGTAKSIVAVGVYIVVLPIVLATRYHLFVGYLVRFCDHIAKLLAHAHVRLARERTFEQGVVPPAGMHAGHEAKRPESDSADNQRV